jgi:hypothetical protein
VVGVEVREKDGVDRRDPVAVQRFPDQFGRIDQDVLVVGELPPEPSTVRSMPGLSGGGIKNPWVSPSGYTAGRDSVTSRIALSI